MGILLLVRHGQASLGTANYDQLSGLGHRQARATGRRLARADLVIERVVCGTLARQRDTAEAALAQLPPPAEPGLRADGRLDEYDHLGLLAAGPPGVSFETVTSAEANRELQPALEAAIARWAAAEAGPGETGPAESHDAFLGRVQAVVDDLAGEPGCTVAVTSGGVIAVACTQALGLPAGRWPALARVIVNGSITKFVSGRSGRNLVTFNDHAHLEDDRSLISYR